MVWLKGQVLWISRGLMTRYPSSTLFPVYCGVSLLNLNMRKKGTLVIAGLLGNLDDMVCAIFKNYPVLALQHSLPTASKSTLNPNPICPLGPEGLGFTG